MSRRGIERANPLDPRYAGKYSGAFLRDLVSSSTVRRPAGKPSR